MTLADRLARWLADVSLEAARVREGRPDRLNNEPERPTPRNTPTEAHRPGPDKITTGGA